MGVLIDSASSKAGNESCLDEDGSCVGVVSAVGENLANDLLSVKDANGKEHLVPFVKELVPIVNLKENYTALANEALSWGKYELAAEYAALAN